ncbi:D-arabinono-1,4-lactone oxidase [Bailinhaonella thermotolerans]|uniref:FAD-binding protein n=1 Tax=Bailinhaonella thermotolerans TaxID=1070861 RepID=A0A3A4B990_9ACTN|nr:D-arabinono-1,4-lactone oxidase [Bailinhaonella thermotolerans]RJL34264.1 FAD-binding protein [Bailinhaonella thermotolerans]
MTRTGTEWRNWAGNQRAVAAEVRTPRSTEEVARAVLDAAERGLRVRMVGTGHSFTDIAATDGMMLRPHGLTAIRSCGPDRVTVEAGLPLKELNRYLDGRGLALANMGDITEQTVSGAIQTGTHGTGREIGGLADQVLELELVLADGSVVTCGPGEDLFDAARVGLGALGVVTAVTFRAEPAFLLRAVEEPMRFSEMLGRLDELTERNEHLDFYWFPHTDGCATKRNNRCAGPARPPSAFKTWLDKSFLQNTVFGAACALGARFPAVIKPVNRVSARLMAGSVYSDVSHKVFTSRRDVRFLEQEYAIPRERLGEALRAVRDVVESGPWRIGFPVEVRVTPPSDAWLSTAYGRASAYIACHVYRETPNEAYFRAVEEIMVSMDGRPHWGKLHTRDASYLGKVYPRFTDFVAMRNRLDPERRFTNAYLDRILGS